MTFFVKFPLGIYNTTNDLVYDCNHYLDIAQEGATSYKGSSSSGFKSFIIGLLNFLPYLLFFIIAIGSSII